MRQRSQSALALFFALACGPHETDPAQLGRADPTGHAGVAGVSTGGSSGSAGKYAAGVSGSAGAGGGMSSAGQSGSAGIGAGSSGDGGDGSGGMGGGSSGDGSASSAGAGVSGSGGVPANGGASGQPGASGTSGASDMAGASAGGAGAVGATIINDRFWMDTSGTPICSQGGGVLQVGDTYYWYGVKYRGCLAYVDNLVDNDDTTFEGITTYSSKDLVNWKHEATDRPSNTGGWFGRLGVAYHAGTEKYVLVAQGGGGLYFATSDDPRGGFVFDHVQTNLPGIVNGSTGDQTIFQDDDGQAYLVSSSSSGRANRYVSPLRASDFLAAEDATLVYRGGGREGNCMFKYDGTYYFCSSDLHGWNSSQAYCVSATNIRGPYGSEFVLDGTQADYSHVTQTGFFILVKGSLQTTIIFAGDRWADFAGNGLGFNQWMPLSFPDKTPRFHSLSAWTLNAATGTWAVAPANNWVLNPTFEADRISVTTPVGWTATNGTNSKDARTGNWSWQLTGNATLRQTVVDLPNGTYTLSAWTKSSGAGAQLHVTNHGSSDQTAPIPAGTSFTHVTLTNVVVRGGQAEVGITTSGQTVTVDDFTLTSE